MLGAVKSNARLAQMAVEVRFDDGFVYLDKCGSTIQAVSAALGPTFGPVVAPTMERAELSSKAELLTVQFNMTSFSVTQRWLTTPSRVEQVAPLAWQVVSDRLDLGRKVVRAGARFWLQWPTEERAGQAALTASGLVSPTESWAQVFGQPSSTTMVGLSELPTGGKIRVSLSTIRQVIDGGAFIPAEQFADHLYESAIQLDIDHVLPENERTLTPAQLKDFIRDRWEKVKVVRNQVDSLLKPHLQGDTDGRAVH